MATLHMTPLWRDKDEDNSRDGSTLNSAQFCRTLPMEMVQHKRFIQKSASHTGFILKENTAIKIILNGVHYVFECVEDLPLVATSLLDQDQALLPGKNYYIYACYDNTDPLNPGCRLVVSLNSTFPKDFTADNSRKIGGFHTLCANVGTISGHPLSDFRAGEILPDSFWCLTCRPATCGPEGMVFLENFNVWVDIYMQSGTGVNTASVYNGTVTKNQSWDSHAEDLAKVGKRMLQDTEFTMAAWGTQPYQAVKGSADPVTTGGKMNDANRRIISNIGCEDMCGCYQIWINEVGANGGSGWGSMNPNDQGSIYGASYALMAGGNWYDGSYAGPRCRDGSASRTYVDSSLSSRGAARTI